MPVYDDSSDEQLMAAARDNDFGAWEAFIRRHGQRLLAFATRMTGDDESSRSVWAQTFEEIWKKRGNPVRGFRPASALFRVAFGLCSGAPESVPVRKLPGDPSSFEVRSARLRQALLSVPRQARAALCLCYFDNLRFDEADRCLACPPGEAQRLCAEGYAALTGALGPGFLNEGLA